MLTWYLMDKGTAKPGRKMKILSMINQKGGSGRSCLSAHLSVAFEQAGISTVILDMDQQASITRWGDSRKAEAPLVAHGQSDRLEKMLKTAAEAGLQLAIIDTPPHTTRISAEAVSVADLILIPTRPGRFETDALDDTVKLLFPAKKEKAAIAVLNGVPTRGSAVADEAEAVLKSFQLEVAPVRIAYRWPLHYALFDGQGITEFEPRGKAAAEIRALQKFLAGRLGLSKRKAST